MKIIVTGGLGHIGSRLIRDLPNAFAGAEILIIDNMLTQRYCSLFVLPQNGRYRFFEEDILTCDLDFLLQGADAVIHLAAITDAANSFNNQEQVELVNYTSTERLAHACLRHKCNLIFPSTTSVYGTQKDIVDENCTVDELKPQSPYAESKLKAEQMLQRLGVSSGLNFVILRLGTIFGISPGMRFHTAVNKFIWQASMGQPITVWRTALDQKRPYLDLDDAINTFSQVVSKNLFDKEIYNVLTTNSTVQEIIDAIRLHIPDLEIEFVDTRIMNQLSYHVSRQKIEAKGISFNGSLAKGVSGTCKMLQQIRSAEKAERKC